MKKIILFVGSIIILVGVGYYWFPQVEFWYTTRVDIPGSLSAKDQQYYQESYQGILNMADKGPNNAWMYNDLGIMQSAFNDYAGAVKSFKRAKDRDPSDPRYLRNMAISQTNMGNYGEAEKSFAAAMVLAPSQPDYWLELGELYSYKMKSPDKARLFYIEALEKTNNATRVIQEYAKFLEQIKKDYPEAIKYWKIMAERDSDNAISYMQKVEELKKIMNKK